MATSGPSEKKELVLGQLLSKACLGGAEILVSHLANCHARSGQPSHVIVLGEPGPLSDRFDPAVKIHYGHFTRASIRNPFRFVASIFQGLGLLRGIIKDNGIQVLQTHLPDTNMWGLVMQLLGSCRVLITIHSNRFLSSKGGTAIGRWVTHHAYLIMVKKCVSVVAVSHKVKESFLKDMNIPTGDARRIVVVENGIPIPAAISPKENAAIRGQFGVSPDECWVIAAGRFAEPKNFQCLIRVAAGVKESGGRMRFLIGGDGPLRPELERLAKELGVLDIVAMPGNLEELVRIMQAADIFAIPSLWEGLPLVLLEAMASRLPVIGSRAQGIKDIIEEGRHGFLSEVNDVAGLVDSLLLLARDEILRNKMGMESWSLVKGKYDIQRVYAEYLTLYQRKVE